MSNIDLSSDEHYKPESLLEHPKTIGRRGLFWVGWLSFLSVVAMWSGAAVRYLVPRVTYEPSNIFKAGRPDDYKIGVVNFITGRKVWIVREEKGIYALIAVCTHLSCQPKWLEEDQIFKCACHGGVFKKNGANVAGPPPRPLDRAHVSLSDDGRLLIDKGNIVDPNFILPV